MDVLILLIFVSVMLVAGAVGLFAWTVRERTHEHTERLWLMPLHEDDPGHREGGTGSE